MEGFFKDIGIAVYGSGDGTGSYKTADGAAGATPLTLSGSFQDGQLTFDAGRFDTLASAVHIARGAITNVYLQLLQKRSDRYNTNIFTWSPIIVTRSDTGATGKLVTIATTDPLDLFLTCTPQGSGQFKWQVKVDGSPGAGDLVVVGVAGV